MKIVKRGQEARDALKKGIDLVADSVRVTLGPSGRNAVLGRLNITPIITNDGVSIARNIEAEDETENLGVMAVKEVASITSNKAKDGTTTTVVLIQAIINSLFEKIKDNGSLITKKVDTMKLKKELDLLCEKVVEMLKAKARPVTPEEIYNVALVSGEYEWLARMVADVYAKVGADGHVEIQEATKTGYDVFPGIKLHSGLQSEYFVNNDKGECELVDPYILVTNQKLEIQPILNLVESLPKEAVEEKKISIVLIAPDFTLDLIKRMIQTHLNLGLTIIPLKLPTFDKDDVLIDIATLTEATFLDKNKFLKGEDFIKAVNFGQLGKVKKATVGPGETILIGGNGDTSARVAEIKRVREKTESQFDIARMDERIAHLSGGFATIRIAAESESERTYFKMKCENTVGAVQKALEGGVVRGGGIAFKEIADELGDNLLSSALVAPYNQLQENSGGTLEVGEDILDPVNTPISAIKSACSLAGLLITTEVTVAYKNEPDTES